MEFSLTGGDLRITLSEGDLSRLGISFEEFDYHDPGQKRILKDLMAAAELETGFCPGRSPLSIHLYGQKDGGACFYIRALPKRAVDRVYRFSDFDALCRAKDAGVFRGYPAGKLYRYRDAFFLVSKESLPVFAEYATLISGRYVPAKLKERARRCDAAWLFGKDDNDGQDPGRMPSLPEM